MIVVFDFDKTLSCKDTVIGFYKEFSTSLPKLFALYFFMILNKLKIISNTLLKQIGIYLFLRGKRASDVEEKGKAYINAISYSQDILSVFFKHLHDNHKVIILSGSFECYLKYLQVTWSGTGTLIIMGSKLALNDEGMITGLSFNCYGENKKRALNEIGVYSIDMLYTDSMSDKELMKIAKKTIIVKQGLYKKSTYDK